MSRLKFGVACSKLKDFTKDVEVCCTDEAQAMALACGAWLAGKAPVVYLQNSGLGHIVDIVTSLYHPYEVPLPKLVLSIRHKPYHHSIMGKKTKAVLALLEYDNVDIIEEEK